VTLNIILGTGESDYNHKGKVNGYVYKENVHTIAISLKYVVTPVLYQVCITIVVLQREIFAVHFVTISCNLVTCLGTV